MGPPITTADVRAQAAAGAGFEVRDLTLPAGQDVTGHTIRPRLEVGPHVHDLPRVEAHLPPTDGPTRNVLQPELARAVTIRPRTVLHNGNEAQTPAAPADGAVAAALLEESLGITNLGGQPAAQTAHTLPPVQGGLMHSHRGMR